MGLGALLLPLRLLVGVLAIGIASGACGTLIILARARNRPLSSSLGAFARRVLSGACLALQWSLCISVRVRGAHFAAVRFHVCNSVDAVECCILFGLLRDCTFVGDREDWSNHARLATIAEACDLLLIAPHSSEIEKRESDASDGRPLVFLPTSSVAKTFAFSEDAFRPAQPCQPVLVRSVGQDSGDSHRGLGARIVAGMTGSHTECTVDLLPIWVPSEAERSDPALYAANVASSMQRRLHTPRPLFKNWSPQ